MRYLETQAGAPVILLGVYQEMLRRNLSASWLFYGMQRETTIKPYFTHASGKLEQVSMPLNHSVDEIKAYHGADRYYRPYRMKAPYSIALLRAVYFRRTTASMKQAQIFPPEAVYEDPEALDLQIALTDRFREIAAQHGQRFAMIFFPTAEQALLGEYPYKRLMEALAARNPGDCLIDPGPALHQASLREGRALAAPVGHFDVIGNKVIAEVVNAGIRACGISATTRLQDAGQTR